MVAELVRYSPRQDAILQAVERGLAAMPATDPLDQLTVLRLREEFRTIRKDVLREDAPK